MASRYTKQGETDRNCGHLIVLTLTSGRLGLQRDVSVLLRAVTQPADLSQRLFAAEAACKAVEASAVTDVAETETGVWNVSKVDPAGLVAEPPPVQALRVVVSPGGGVEPLAQHGHAVLPVEVAQTARPVALHGLTDQVISPGVAAVEGDPRQSPRAVRLLDEDGRVRVQAEAGQVVLGESLLDARQAAGVELVPGEALLQVVREVEAAAEAGEVRHTQSGGRRKLRSCRG